MIRRVELQDAKAIAAIYNEYVIHLSLIHI